MKLPSSLEIRVFDDNRLLGIRAAQQAARLITDAIAARGKARILIATGNSQIEMMNALVGHSEVDWSRVEAFHLDEYVGISDQHPASFRLWIRTRFENRVRPGLMAYLPGDAPNVDSAAAAYAARLFSEPIDLAFVGIGENGHIAFNDPPVADFNDPLGVKRVMLDEPCRRQQVGEGHFPSFDAVPKEALTVTCSGLLKARSWVSCVPDLRKARAVKDSLEGPISPSCPGSLIRRHPHVTLYLDQASASLLSDRSALIHTDRFMVD
ncbi:MAG: glucosamine-6-phosphate deaminase [Opitutaceae bacterium]|nr:glucosamine-6-phosphate deaminase [Opitutaceae bacterium]